MFARRLRDLNKPVHIRVFDNLPHGFLCLPRNNPATAEANDYVVQQMLNVLLGCTEVTDTVSAFTVASKAEDPIKASKPQGLLGRMRSRTFNQGSKNASRRRASSVASAQPPPETAHQ
jgi:hypothetical protein